ncbi:MAG: energy transducer TonB, partial [Candidatus Poribacteria bacterium]|nr:energy transducer TonB [Candidatus Poribacteria bacterium]
LSQRDLLLQEFGAEMVEIPPIKPRIVQRRTKAPEIQPRTFSKAPMQSSLTTNVDLPLSDGSFAIAINSGNAANEAMRHMTVKEAPALSLADSMPANIGAISLPVTMQSAYTSTVVPEIKTSGFGTGLSSILSSTVAIETRQDAFQDFLVEIRERIVKSQDYPRYARELGLEGTVTLRVAVRRNGSIVGVSVAVSSGSEWLDDAAIGSAKAAGPFNPLPDTYKGDVLRLEVPVVFRLTGDA